MARVVTIEHEGSFNNTMNFLKWGKKIKFEDLARFGEEGVNALRSATPVRSGKTADSWYYQIVEDNGEIRLEWLNKNLGQGWAPIALLIQYGHGTRNGGYVQGIDYINPALKPIFDKIADRAWKEVTSHLG